MIDYKNKNENTFSIIDKRSLAQDHDGDFY